MTASQEREVSVNKPRRKGRLQGILSGSLGDLVSSSAWVFAARILAMVLGFGTTVVVARWYGKEATGMVALLNATAILFGTVAIFGQDSYLMRKFGTSEARGLKRRAYTHSLKLAVVMAALLAGPVVFALLPRLPVAAQQAWPWAIPIILLSLFGVMLSMLATQLTRALTTALAYAAFLLVPSLLSLVLVVAGGVVLPLSLLVPSAAVALAVGGVGIYALKYNFTRLKEPQPAPPPGPFQEPSGLALMRLGLPFFISTISAILVMEGNIVISGVIMPAAELGVYAIAFKISILAGFGISTVSLVAAPKLARLAASGTRDDLQKFAQQASTLVLVTSMPILLVLAFGKDWLIISAFGEDFAEAGLLLAILLIGQFTAIISGVATPYLTMTGHQRILAKIIGFSAFVTCAFTLILTSRFGTIGSAYALVGGMVIWNFSALVAVRVYDGFWLIKIPNPRQWMKGRAS